MKISELMTPLPITLSPDTSIQEAKRVMYQHSIRHLPVTEGKRLVGILTDRDLKLAHAVMKKDEIESASVADLCITEVYSCAPETPAQEVLDHMVKHHIGSAIIEGPDGLAGVFTLSDACRALSSMLKKMR